MSTASSGLRSLHLVDIETLVGNPRADAAVVLHTFDRYLAAARWSAGDHVIVAANPKLMAKVAFDLPVPANVHCAPGRDGADTKLLDTVAPHTIATRYDRLVIGSGDGIFLRRARASAEAGIAVHVVARPDGCARTLHRFAHTFLPPSADVVLAA
ncbi:MAG: hypothetical protein U0W40_12385 [Acidimicrobiia bacterium]